MKTFTIGISLMALGLAPALGLPSPLNGQDPDSGSFRILVGGELLAVESFRRGPSGIEGKLSGEAVGRIEYRMSATASGASSTTMSFWSFDAPAESAPSQEVRLDIEGGQITARVTNANGTSEGHFAAPEGTLPYLNPSFALLQELVRESSAGGEGSTTTHSVFMVQGGEASEVQVHHFAPDSVLIWFSPEAEIRARVSPSGDLQSGEFPARRMRFERTQDGSLPSARTAPDYTAPADAPYVAESVSVPTRGTHILAGTLTVPVGMDSTPGAILITGSGRQDRDSRIPGLPGYQPFREIADALSRQGVAVLRLDDRGVGESTGDFSAATTADFADDVRSAVEYMRTLDHVDPSRIFLIGHSEGGMIAPKVAAGDSTLAGIILLAGPAQTGLDIALDQQRRSIASNPTVSVEERDQVLTSERARLLESAESDPWLRYFLEYDPLPAAAMVRIPALVLHGATDQQVSVDQASLLRDALARGGSRVQLRVLPEVNHLFLRDPDGRPGGYPGLPDRRVVPEALEAIGDWIMRQGEGVDPAPVLGMDQTRWVFEADGPIYASPVVRDQVVYVGSDDGNMYALEAATGQELWRFSTEGAVDARPAVDQGTVYFPSRDGAFHAVDRGDGRLRWAFTTGGEARVDFWDFYLSDPLISGDLVVFGSGDGFIYALDRESGAEVWKHRTDGPVHGSPVADEDHVYVGGFDGVLYAIELRTGTISWQFRAEGNASFPSGSFQRGPALHDGVLYIGSRDYRLYAVEASTGKELWTIEDPGGWIIATPLIAEDIVHFGVSDGQTFYAANRHNGSVQWSVPIHTRVFGSAVLVDESVVFGGFNGKLTALHRSSGRPLWTFQTQASRDRFFTVYDADGRVSDEMRSLYQTGRGREAEERMLALGSIPGTPVLHERLLIFGTTEGLLYALDLDSGR